MTWVIAASSILGTGALISDTRVRFSNGTTAELLQKAFPVSNYIAAGFAGSVRIGFELIESLKSAMFVPDGVESHVWMPRAVALRWSPIARQIFSDASNEEKQNGSQLLLVGVSPTEEVLGSHFARVDVVRFVAPDFIPKFAKSGFVVRHIGSGARIPQYKRAIRPLFRLSSGIHRAHIAGIHEWARTLTFSVTIAVRDNPNSGISEHFHLVALSLGNMAVFTNDMNTYIGDHQRIELRMPPVAQSWQEFESMARAIRANASAAVC